MSNLEERIARLEDIEAIKKLKTRYCAICDDNHNPEEITKLFAADGIIEGEAIGKHQGRAAIRELFQRSQELFSFSQHNITNPIIEVDGNHATGTWYLLGPFTVRKGNEPRWIAVRYEEDYVKIDGEWKFQRVSGLGRMSAPYETGWAKKVSSGGR
jgi:hypothetical protein